MTLKRAANDSLQLYLKELSSRIVANSGIPLDQHHIGKLILQSLKEDPDFVVQVDGATNESETASSLLRRTVRCATGFRKMGLVHGDVITLIAPNHLDVAVPMYAALYLGIIVSIVDRTSTLSELEHMFNLSQPKMIFWQSEKTSNIQVALNNLNLKSNIVTFDKTDYLLSFKDFMETYGDDTSVENFEAANLNPEDTIAFLIGTSGTTGPPKAAAVTHKNVAISTPNMWIRGTQFPEPTRLFLVTSALQWTTAMMTFILSPILRYTRLQTSAALTPITPEHCYYLINTYKPTSTLFSSVVMFALMKPGVRDQCDFTCLETLMLAGSPAHMKTVGAFKMLSPNTEVVNSYGMSELSGVAFDGDNSVPKSCGKPVGCFQYRIVNDETQEDINEPLVSGELWLKGPGIFKEYYNNKAATEEAFAKGGWFKTGDSFYRDENWNFFFVERIKLLLKYKCTKISPVEIEGVIHQLPGILEVAVTGIPDPECGDLPIAFVVTSSEHELTAEAIKDFVKENLSDAKQLRGGVIFVDAIPMTASAKINRRKLKVMALSLPRGGASPSPS